MVTLPGNRGEDPSLWMPSLEADNAERCQALHPGVQVCRKQGACTRLLPWPPVLQKWQAWLLLWTGTDHLSQ